jgi:aminopeptidase N
MIKISRLIDHFVPKNYKLSLVLNRPKRTFSGTVSITGKSINKDYIYLHAKDLIIQSVTCDGKAVDFSPCDHDELKIHQADLQPGNHIIVIGFSGQITDTMHGLYPCYYNHKGKKQELLATQFESHHAREVFPCVDEPLAKAIFDVTLTTESDVTVLGNMPIKQQRAENNQLVTTFEQTPRMSTYLLAWVIGELYKKSEQTNNGVEVNVWATPAQPAESLGFALNIARRCIEFYDDYFGTPYPLPKSDHVALPDFSAGAMENWGLVTYREVALLANPKTTSLSSKQYIATIIAHELSHQWFGNLVTMKWWDDLWLNESFATLMGYLAIDYLQPDWYIWLDFASSEAVLSLRRDSIDGVQAVQADVNHPDGISALFDGAIVYAKGARLLYMTQHYIGKQAFQAGLKAYFNKHAYGNTIGNDLWNELSIASGKDIKNLMNTWISQSGFPVVKVSLKKNQLTLAQEQFFIGPHQTSNQLWPIPLNASSSDLPTLLTAQNQVITLEKPLQTPLRLNVDNTAHFITQYDISLLNQLITAIKDNSLQPLDRLQLLNEQILLTRGRLVSSAELIPLLAVYKNETIDAVWDNIAVAINELRKFVDPKTPTEKALRAFVGQLAKIQYKRLGWQPVDGESKVDTKLRPIIIALTLYARDTTALAEAARLYRTHNLIELNPELRSAVVSSVVYNNTSQTFIDKLLKIYKSASAAELKEDIIAGITSTQVPKFIKQLLDLIKDITVVRPQDNVYWLAYLLRNRAARVLTWQWLRDNWAWIKQTFSGDMSYNSYPRYAANVLSTRQELTEYREFFTPMRSDPALSRTIAMGISEIEGRVELIEHDQNAVQQTLLKLN